MWLLRTDNAELVYRPSSEGIVYAILSHVWGPYEQSFQDIQALHRRDGGRSPTAQNPRSVACDKIRRFCIYAEAAGYEWAWIDTCCIDKTSSAELSEALNSMFTWYANADVCYAWLADVPDDDDPEQPGSAFRQSRWFTRFWTLQELIAPLDVVFLSQDWLPLCSKCALPGLVEEITGVDIEVLLSAARLHSVPAAKRLSWASQRETTRLEDEAYSLMGIFGVNIPIMYGEGRRAFRRLQEEIMKQSPDHTLFVWGLAQSCTVADLWAHAPWTNYPRKAVHEEVDVTSQVLFAQSPQAFRGSLKVQSMSVRKLGVAAQIALSALNQRQPEAYALNSVLSSPHEVPEFTVTGYGVRARLPIIQVCDDDTSIAVAVLACQGSEGGIVGLLLHEQENAGGIPLYRIGVHTIYHNIDRPYPLYRLARYVRIHLAGSYPPQSDSEPSRQFALRWQEVYLVHDTHTIGLGATRWTPAPVPGRPVLGPCRLFFPSYMLARLARLGFVPERTLSGPATVSALEPLEVLFTHPSTQAAFSIRIACCLRPAMSLPSAQPGEGSWKVSAQAGPFRHMWATVDASWLPVQEVGGPVLARGSSSRSRPTSEELELEEARRCYWCRETHLDQWTALDAQSGRTGRQMSFPFVGRTVKITFSHWDARRTTDQVGAMYAVNIEVEEGPSVGVPEPPQHRHVKNTHLKVKAQSEKRRSSSIVRSMLAAVHQQVRGKH